jgi:DnaK suppressor protein
MPTTKKTTKKTAKKATKKAAKKTPALTADYDPSEDKKGYMNPVMLEFFRQKLIDWRQELIKESSETIANTLQETELQKPDLADRASAETDHALELRTRDRERKLINKINSALRRIDEDEYGYCEETGDEIGVARLQARPVATMTLEAQEMHERNEKIHRED